MYNLNGIDSKFRLAILVARRAKQLIGGARRKIEIKTDNPLTVAMEEFRQGKIDFNVLNEEPSLFGEIDMEQATGTGESTLSGEMIDGKDVEVETETETKAPQLEPEP